MRGVRDGALVARTRAESMQRGCYLPHSCREGCWSGYWLADGVPRSRRRRYVRHRRCLQGRTDLRASICVAHSLLRERSQRLRGLLRTGVDVAHGLLCAGVDIAHGLLRAGIDVAHGLLREWAQCLRACIKHISA